MNSSAEKRPAVTDAIEELPETCESSATTVPPSIPEELNSKNSSADLALNRSLPKSSSATCPDSAKGSQHPTSSSKLPVPARCEGEQRRDESSSKGLVGILPGTESGPALETIEHVAEPSHSEKKKTRANRKATLPMNAGNARDSKKSIHKETGHQAGPRKRQRRVSKKRKVVQNKKGVTAVPVKTVAPETESPTKAASSGSLEHLAAKDRKEGAPMCCIDPTSMPKATEPVPLLSSPPSNNEKSLAERYDDLLERYHNILRVVVQPSSTKEPSSGKAGDVKDLVSQTNTYRSIYLSRLAEILSSLQLHGKKSNLMGECLLQYGHNPYQQCFQDAIDFIDKGMKLGPADSRAENCIATIFRDVHMKLVDSCVERDSDVQLLLALVRCFSKKIKQWYSEILAGTIQVQWTSVISERIVAVLCRKLHSSSSECVAEVEIALRGVLLQISAKFERAEQNQEEVSVAFFCASCEVSTSIARSVPEVANALADKDAFAIGRHNPVFTHCIIRRHAEQLKTA